MYGKWAIPADVCNTRPIGRDNLNYFVGHVQDMKQISKALDRSSVVLLEGEVGLGKTSLGNAVRFSDSYISPNLELQCDPQWTEREFIINVLCSLRKTLSNLNSNLTNAEVLKKIDVLSGKSQMELKLIFKDLIDFTKERFPENQIVFQMNNLDLNNTFDKDTLFSFLNQIRDVLQTPHISWIMCGVSGLKAFIQKKVKRLDQIIAVSKTITPISHEDLKISLMRRMGDQAWEKFPIEESLVELIYRGTGYSIRESFNLYEQLLNRYCDDPMVDVIQPLHAQRYADKVYSPRKVDASAKSALDLILANPGCSQGFLVQELGLSQPRVSTLCRRLEEDRILRINKNGTVNECTLEILYQLSRQVGSVAKFDQV